MGWVPIGTQIITLIATKLVQKDASKGTFLVNFLTLASCLGESKLYFKSIILLSFHLGLGNFKWIKNCLKAGISWHKPV